MSLNLSYRRSTSSFVFLVSKLIFVDFFDGARVSQLLMKGKNDVSIALQVLNSVILLPAEKRIRRF